MKRAWSVFALAAWACVPPPGKPSYDPDVDGDGIGQREGDCDDDDPSIGLPGTWFPDGDGDGFGALGADVQLLCEPGPGFAASADDCDDAAADVYPGAPEPCGDGIDHDCDDAPSLCALSGVVSLDDAVLTVRGHTFEGALLAPAGRVLAGGGDALGVGTGPPPTDSGNPEYRGDRGWVVGLGASGEVLQHEIHFGAEPGQHSRVVGAPDLTGDGQPDLFAATFCYYGGLGDPPPGCLLDGPQSRAYLIPGPIDGPIDVTTHAPAIPLDAPDRSCPGLAAIAVGERLAVSGCGTEDHGVVWVIDGPLAGSADLEDAAGILTGDEGDGAMGWRLASGDLDGDGLQDLVIGTYGSSSLSWPPLGMEAVVVDGSDLASGRGRARALGRSFTTGRLPIPHNSGAAVAAADVDGDGLDDGLLGTSADSGYGVGRIWRLPPSEQDLDLNLATVDRIDGVDSSFAVGLGSAGDTNGDGCEDLLAGAPQARGAPGGAWLISGADLRGAVTLDDIDPLAIFNGRASAGQLGYDVLSPGDLDGDGWPDVAIGARAPSDAVETDADVVVYAFLGGAAR